MIISKNKYNNNRKYTWFCIKSFYLTAYEVWVQIWPREAQEIKVALYCAGYYSVTCDNKLMTYHHLILNAKNQYFSKLVSSSSDNPRRLWQTVNKLLNCKSVSPLPSSSAATSIADRFAYFFTDKISKLRLSLANTSSSTSPHSPSPPVTPPDFSVFKPTSESEVSKILSNSPNKQCDSDPIPTWLLKECASVIIPTITNIVNLSLSSGLFHPVFKQSIVSLLKKSTLDNEQLSNYRRISNLSLISKIMNVLLNCGLLITSFLTIC